LRDLHTLGAYIDRAARRDSDAIEELNYRIETLRAGEDDAVWHTAWRS
jgi:hypothetical protein